ncbi:unnamed protein product [Callosobruchus maculatus]|uniref:Uncharacterized protein n=1 Tax=Callosobruchus maculatus TaxID=64391 RepID=A0A653DW43_CALMS|nr:unnamed protein product [Callosobruchus maculatus]
MILQRFCVRRRGRAADHPAGEHPVRRRQLPGPRRSRLPRRTWGTGPRGSRSRRRTDGQRRAGRGIAHAGRQLVAAPGRTGQGRPWGASAP